MFDTDVIYELTQAELAGEWEESDRQVLPDDFELIPPSLILAAYLLRIDRSRLNGHDLVVVMRAEARMEAHYAAQRMATITEVAYSPNGDADSAVERSEVLAEFASEDLSAGLNLTRRAADVELGFALELRERLPKVWELLNTGLIDVRRARTIAQGTTHLTVDAAREVADRIIHRAPKLTTGQLAARIRRLCVETDPEEAQTRYEDSLAERRVVIEANVDGTADLHAYGLPADRAVAIGRKVSRLARNLRKSDGSRTMDQLRADVFVDLLCGNHVSGGRAGGMVDIRVDMETLVGLTENPGELAGFGPVIADIARRVTAEQENTEWRWTMVDDNNQVLHTGITTRRPTTAQKRHVQARFRYCVFPGCRMPSADCDLDHRVAVADGGPTTTCNLAPPMPSPPSGQTRSTLATHHPTQRQPHLAQPTRTHLHHQRPIALTKGRVDLDQLTGSQLG